MLRPLNRLSGGMGVMGTPYVGKLASELPTGFALPGLLNNDVLSGDPVGCMYRVEILPADRPSSGTLTIEETGAFALVGAVDGTYSGPETVYKNDVAEAGTYSLAIGTVTADTTGPTMAGPITATATQTSITVSVPAATDTSGIGSYAFSIDGGALINTGLAQSRTFSSLAAGTLHTFTGVAYDTLGNVTGAPLTLTFSTLAAVVIPDPDPEPTVPPPAPTPSPYMMPITGLYAEHTYAWLKAMVLDWTHRSTLAARIPEFIMLAESTINRKLGITPREIDVQLATIAGSRFIARPTDMARPIELWLESEQPRVEVIPALPTGLPVTVATSGPPTFWAIDGFAIAFERPADQVYPLTFRYLQDARLSDTNQSNELLARSPDLYLYGALAQAAPYCRDDARVSFWQSEFKRILREIQIENSRTKSLAPLRTDVPSTWRH